MEGLEFNLNDKCFDFFELYDLKYVLFYWKVENG